MYIGGRRAGIGGGRGSCLPSTFQNYISQIESTRLGTPAPEIKISSSVQVTSSPRCGQRQTDPYARPNSPSRIPVVTAVAAIIRSNGSRCPIGSSFVCSMASVVIANVIDVLQDCQPLQGLYTRRPWHFCWLMFLLYCDLPVRGYRHVNLVVCFFYYCLHHIRKMWAALGKPEQYMRVDY